MGPRAREERIQEMTRNLGYARSEARPRGGSVPRRRLFVSASRVSVTATVPPDGEMVNSIKPSCRTYGVVHGWCEDAIAVVSDEPMRALKRDAVPKLLNGPGGRGMRGDIPVHDSACRDVEEDEDVQPLKCGRDDQEEVAREHSTRMIVEECGPALWRPTTRRARLRRHVATSRMWLLPRRSMPTLVAVVNDTTGTIKLRLTPKEERDLIEYLKSI
jgi:hypothetical protein